MKTMQFMTFLTLAGVLVMATFRADARPDTGSFRHEARIAIATFAAHEEQVRSVTALIKSIRQRGGSCRASTIFVVTADPELMPAVSLKQEGVELLPLEMERAFLDYPLALKAFAAAQIEKKAAAAGIDTLIWLDPGVIVLNSLAALDLGEVFDAAVRPVTLANTIAIPPQTAPDDYWEPIYRETGLDFKSLPSFETIVDPVPIQPYFNCEVFSFNPRLGIAAEWARLLTRFLKDEKYQKNVCTSFLRKLFLHQAVLSAVIISKAKPDRIKALPLAGSYPFSQHERLPAAIKTASLNDLSVAIFDYAWDRTPDWMRKIRSEEPLKQWLFDTYLDYLRIAPAIYRVEGSCNSYLVTSSDGCVLIDPAGAAVAPEFFRKILATSPLKAILLTHAHPDHSNDIGEWLGDAEIPVVAQREFKSYFEYIGELQGFFSRRNAIWRGRIPGEAEEKQPRQQQRPTVYFGDEHELELGGLHFKLLHTPGETPDHTTIWIPELSAVFVGDNYYEYFINNSTFRGTMIRPVRGYIHALDTALAFAPECFLMGHGTPVLGRQKVQETVGNFRAALKHVHDETVRGINAGKDVYTLMREIRLPEKLAVAQYFGKVEWTVRGIWQEYVGWFDENPATMYDLPASAIDADLVELAGSGAIVEKAKEYFDKKEYVKVLHLTDMIVHADPHHQAANEIRIAALKALQAGSRNFIEGIWLKHGIRCAEDRIRK